MTEKQEPEFDPATWTPDKPWPKGYYKPVLGANAWMARFDRAPGNQPGDGFRLFFWLLFGSASQMLGLAAVVVGPRESFGLLHAITRNVTPWPLLLLFTTARRGDTEFTFGGRETSPAGSAWVLRYRQTAASGALTEFRNSRQLKHLPEGTIWLREGDLLPLRITLETEEYVTAKYRFRNEAEVEYRPTPFGLAPHLVVHRQLLNGELLVENRFSYSAWRGQEIIP